MKDVFIVEANRSPFGKIGGLSPVRPDDLLASVLKDLTSRFNFPLEEIDDRSCRLFQPSRRGQ